MRAINHATVGAIIGLSIPQPVIAFALAIVSHFVLDALPHYGSPKKSIGSVSFTRMLLLDVLLCFLLVVILFFRQPNGWFLAAVCAFLATSPDFMWAAGFWQIRKGKKYVIPDNPVARFHAKIQWFERPLGGVVEIVWLLGTGWILLEKLV